MKVPGASLEAIAKAAAVSVPTASLALNNHARVSARTRIRVSQAAARLGAFEMKTDLSLTFKVDANVSEGGEDHSLSMHGPVGGNAAWKLKSGAH